MIREHWVNCFKCMKVHMKLAECLSDTEKEEANWFPCFWASRGWVKLPFLDIPQKQEALEVAEDETWKRLIKVWAALSSNVDPETMGWA